MKDQWFYRVFGEDFGPVPIEKLREMADQGTIGASDEVRSSDSHRWVLAGTVNGLGLDSSRGGAAVATAGNSDTSIDVPKNRSGFDDWYCLVHAQELGPFTFDELVKYSEQGNVSADDEVKLGVNGKWRRIGSIGRLVAVLPFRPIESKTPLPAKKSRVKASSKDTPAFEISTETTVSNVPASNPDAVIDSQATYQAAYALAKAEIAKSMMQHAESEFKSAEESAKAELAWAFAPNVDPNWWGWMGSVEFGPVGFMQVFALAKTGQLKPPDFIRNGMTGQYFPASNAPGLFNAVATIAKATEALRLATAQAQTAVALAGPAPDVPVLAETKATPAASTSRVSEAAKTTLERDLGRTPSVASVVSGRPNVQIPPENTNGSESLKQAVASVPEPVRIERKQVAPLLEPEAVSVTSSMNVGYSSSQSSSSSYSATRPIAVPVRPVPRPVPSRGGSSSSSLADSIELLKEPKAQGVVAALALLLLFVGWQYMPKNNSAMVTHFRELKQIVDEVKAKRLANSNDYASLLVQAEKTSKTITANLAKKASRDNPVTLTILWAARDELPRMLSGIKQSPTAISKAEDSFVARLRDAAQQLKLKDWGGLPAPPPAPELASNELPVD